ncbi:TPA: hypothetical protein [Aquificae Joseph's Coat Spring virus]|nr:TPA: hypothetical protein [Aquificae Joseph's Coat Spring virus]
MAKKKAGKDWIQGAVKHPGAFTEWCEKQGFNGVTQECIEKGKKSSNETTRRRAVLAETFKKMGKKRKEEDKKKKN